jgi:hypothetical protein
MMEFSKPGEEYLFGTLRFRTFEFVSNFGFRASDLTLLSNAHQGEDSSEAEE